MAAQADLLERVDRFVWSPDDVDVAPPSAEAAGWTRAFEAPGQPRDRRGRWSRGGHPDYTDDLVLDVGLDPDTARRVQATTDQLADRYGIEITRAEYSREPGTVTMIDSTGTLGVNPLLLNDRYLATGVASGRTAHGEERVEGPITHEYGHLLLENPQRRRVADQARMDAWDAARKAGYDGSKEQIQRDVSKYALDSPEEEGAEVFANYHLGGKDRSPWVVAWGDAFDKSYGAKAAAQPLAAAAGAAGDVWRTPGFRIPDDDQEPEREQATAEVEVFHPGHANQKVHGHRHATPITAAEARGNSRPVSMEEFQRLAHEGQEQIGAFRDHAAAPTGLDRNWDAVRDTAWSETRKSWGGATFDAHTGKTVQPTTGYVLSVKSRPESVSVAEDAGRVDFDRAMDTARSRFREELSMQSGHLGVFHDDDLHRVDIDPVIVVASRHEVETIGAATHAIGGAYSFADGNGYWPPHVAVAAAAAAGGKVHWRGLGEWYANVRKTQHTQAADEAEQASGWALQAAAGDASDGAMVALVPTDQDAAALALDGDQAPAGAEAAGQLHLTLAYLGDAADWSEAQRDAVLGRLRPLAAMLPAGAAHAFGAAHWNTDTEEPAWVLNVGGEDLDRVHRLVWDLLTEDAEGFGPVPAQHVPWVPHVCVLYDNVRTDEARDDGSGTTSAGSEANRRGGSAAVGVSAVDADAVASPGVGGDSGATASERDAGDRSGHTRPADPVRRGRAPSVLNVSVRRTDASLRNASAGAHEPSRGAAAAGDVLGARDAVRIAGQARLGRVREVSAGGGPPLGSEKPRQAEGVSADADRPRSAAQGGQEVPQQRGVPDARSGLPAAAQGPPSDATIWQLLDQRVGRDVTFDRLRVAFGDQVTDLPLHGTEATVAATEALFKPGQPRERRGRWFPGGGVADEVGGRVGIGLQSYGAEPALWDQLAAEITARQAGGQAIEPTTPDLPDLPDPVEVEPGTNAAGVRAILPSAGSQGAGMPWEVRDDHPDCAGYAVVGPGGKLADGGCHARKQDAVAHQRALYANTDEEGAAVTQTATEPAAKRGKQGMPPGMRNCPPGTKDVDGDCVALEDLAVAGDHLTAHVEALAVVDNSTWDGNAAMSTCSTAACYRAICAGRKAGPPDQRSSWALPHHKSEGGPPNAAGVRAALARFSSTQGLTNSDAARSHLDAHMATIRGRAEAAGITAEQFQAWLDGTAPATVDQRIGEALGGDPSQGTDADGRLAENKAKKRTRRTSAATESSIEATGDGRWEGILVIEGIPTGDGREFAPDSLHFAEFPLPLTYQPPTHGGEPGPAVDVGVIEHAWRDDDNPRVIRGRGRFDMADAQAADYYRKVEERFLRGMSVDLDDIDPYNDVEVIWPEGLDQAGPEVLFAPPSKRIFHKARVRGAALLSMPAFVEAQMWAEGAEPPALPDLDELEQTARAEEAARLDEEAAMTAAATGLTHLDTRRPPRAWFQDPELGQRCPITVSAEGRVYGHAFRWDDCHIGYAGECVPPPREDDFPYFTQGEVLCADGSRVAVGQITIGTGHAPLRGLSWRAAAEHYDNTGTVVADVAIGIDRVGAWVAGAVRPGASEQMVYALRASGQVSGDWRSIGGQLRLVALLGVNVPGFPVPRPEARVAGGQVQALVAAGMLDVGPRVDWERELEQRALRSMRDRLLAAIPDE